jgi:acyl-CoA thioesterase II
VNPRGDDDPTSRLLRLLELEERGGPDAFRAATPAPGDGPPRLFGGQVAAQSLRAATLTVDTDDRPPHSMHAYFIRPGKPGVPLDLDVVRARDGRSFSTRTVTASQDGEAIFVCAASFHTPEEGEDWPGVERLDAPLPGDEVTESPLSRFATMSPFDMRPIAGLSEMGWVLHPFWVRTKGRLPDDPAILACVIAFISDMGVVGSARGRSPASPRDFMGASLDHALWFHRPGRPDDWLLFDVHPLTNAGARGLARGTLHASDGTLVASIVQEALLRPSGITPLP